MICLVLEFNGSSFKVSPLNMMLVYKLRYKIFHHAKEESFNFHFIFLNLRIHIPLMFVPLPPGRHALGS